MTDDDLRLEIGDNWTAATMLAHLAFWDYRALVLLNRWKKIGIGPSPIDIDGVNDAVFPPCLAIAPRVAANLAVSAAEAIDHALECASPEMIAEIEAMEGKFRLNRWEHRREHLGQIERFLGAAITQRRGTAVDTEIAKA